MLKDVKVMRWQHSNHFERPLLQYMFAEERRINAPEQVRAREGDMSIFVYVIKESIRISLEIEGTRASGRIEAGEVVFIPAHSDSTLSSASASSARVLLIYFRWQDRLKGRKSLGHQPGLQARLTNRASKIMGVPMLHLHNRILDFLKTDRSSELRLYYQSQSYLYALASAYLAYVQRPVKAGDTLLEYVQQMKQSLLERVDHTLDMEEMARSSGYGATRFYRMFRKLTGLSPHKFMTTVRLNRSLSLLASTQLSVTEIAHSLGYSDELYFSRLFKKNMGLTPTEFSKRAQKRIVVLHPVLAGNLSVLGLSPYVSLEEDWTAEADKHLGVIEEAQPELIFSTSLAADTLALLEKIAPTVQLNLQELSWRERLLIISQEIGLAKVAERWLIYYDLKVKNAMQLLEDHAEKQPFLIASLDSAGFRVYGWQNRMLGDFFYTELGVGLPECVREIDEKDFNSIEELAQLACSHLLLLAPSWLEEEELLQIEDTWKKLRQHVSNVNCLIVRYTEVLLDHPVCYDHLLEQMMNLLVQEH